MDNFIVNTLIGVLLLGIVSIPVVFIMDGAEFRKYNCVKTEETRITPVSTTLVIGKMILPQTNLVQQHKYTCDDTVRWR